MVSFSCELCNDTVVKKKLAQHKQRCRDAAFTCIDCSVTFYNNDWNLHTSCISEAQKYEKALYKPKQKKQEKVAPVKTVDTKAEQVREDKSESKKDKSGSKNDKAKSKKDKTFAKDKKTNIKPTASDSLLLKFTSSLKVDKPKSFKKVLKKFSKSEQKELLEQLKVTHKDGRIVVHL